MSQIAKYRSSRQKDKVKMNRKTRVELDVIKCCALITLMSFVKGTSGVTEMRTLSKLSEMKAGRNFRWN